MLAHVFKLFQAFSGRKDGKELVTTEESGRRPWGAESLDGGPMLQQGTKRKNDDGKICGYGLSIRI